MEQQGKYISALDIGTSKVIALIGEVQDDNEIHIVGLGQAPSRGLKAGMVTNIDATAQAIQQAVNEAELMADTKISHVTTGIAGNHIRSLNSQGVVKIKDGEVSQADIDRAIETAKAINIPPDHNILHTVVQEYIIDNQPGVKEPIGMSGVRLDTRVHIITGANTALQNIQKCIHRCGLQMDQIMLQPLASGQAVLTEDEKDLGVCVIDIGGGTTEVAVIAMGGIVVSQSIRIAGDEFDQAILTHVRDAYNLAIGERTAEDIKIKVGSAVPLKDELDVEVNGRDVITGLPKTVRIESEEIRRALNKPLDEMAKAVKDALDATPPDLASDLMYYGILLTGGGALLRGLDVRLRDETGVSVNVSPTALDNVVNGCARVLEANAFDGGFVQTNA